MRRYTSHRMVGLKALKWGCALWLLHNVFLKSCTERLPVSWEKHRKVFPVTLLTNPHSLLSVGQKLSTFLEEDSWTISGKVRRMCDYGGGNCTSHYGGPWGETQKPLGWVTEEEKVDHAHWLKRKTTESTKQWFKSTLHYLTTGRNHCCLTKKYDLK